MSENEGILLEAFEHLIGHHRKMYGQLRMFHLHSDELSAYIYEQELASSVTDAFEIIEHQTENESKFILDDWSISYDLIRELWVFCRGINLYDIRSESNVRVQRLKRDLSKHITSLGPRSFELLLFELFSKIDAYNEPSIRPQSHDGGYEMFIRTLDPVTKSSSLILVQAKHQYKSVSVSQVRELIGTLNVESNAHRDRSYRGLMVSIKSPSPMALEAARMSTERIDFLSLCDLVDLMYSHEIGWKSEQLSFSFVDEEFWNEVGCEDA